MFTTEWCNDNIWCDFGNTKSWKVALGLHIGIYLQNRNDNVHRRNDNLKILDCVYVFKVIKECILRVLLGRLWVYLSKGRGGFPSKNSFYAATVPIIMKPLLPTSLLSLCTHFTCYRTGNLRCPLSYTLFLRWLLLWGCLGDRTNLYL